MKGEARFQKKQKDTAVNARSTRHTKFRYFDFGRWSSLAPKRTLFAHNSALFRYYEELTRLRLLS